ncbi:MAG: hypothetical protein PVH61_44200 [Candidatus Aminicenantes bacterium]|jgi:hypothetical protein
MTTMLSLILAFMLTMGGSPAVSISPVNSIGPESGVSHDITGKPRLDEFQKNYPVVAKPNAGKPRLVLNLSFQYKKTPLINLNQAFGMNPVNFNDPFGKRKSYGLPFGGMSKNEAIRRLVLPKVKVGVEAMHVSNKRVMTSALNATAGNAVNVIIFLATANPIGWAVGERPAFVFTCSDDPYTSDIVNAQFMMVDAKPLEDLKNATVVIPMVERTVDYMKNMSSDSPESAKYCQLNVVQFGMDLYCLSEMGSGLLNLNKGRIINQYKNESGGTVRIVEMEPVQSTALVKYDPDFAVRQILGEEPITPGGRIILDHAARRMKMPPEWREPMTMIEVDQVLDTATRIKKISPHPEGITVTVQNPNMPGKPQIVIDSETGIRVITVIKNKVKNK